MLTNGCRVAGVYDGKSFTGNLYELNHISSIELDNGIIGFDGRYTERLHMYTDNHKASQQFWEIAESPVNSEYVPGELSEIARESLAKQFKPVKLSEYRAMVQNRLMTYKTVKQAVTCEYGHKHMIDRRVPVAPAIDEKLLNIEFFFYCLAEYARYLEEREYVARNETWNRLARKLSLSAIAYDGTFEGLDTETIKHIRAELSKQYDDLCFDYQVKIYGAKYMPRHIRSCELCYKNDLGKRYSAYLEGIK